MSAVQSISNSAPAMTQQEFADTAIDHLFIQGYHFPCYRHGISCTRDWWANSGERPDLLAFVQYSKQFNLAQLIAVPGSSILPSTLGAGNKCIAIHEAGHAIVGVKAGLCLVGICFFGADGYPGLALFEDTPLHNSMDVALLRAHIRTDVAGNIAEVTHPPYQSLHGGRLSCIYDEPNRRNYPMDFQNAHQKAIRVAALLQGWDGWTCPPEVDSKATRIILEQAEVEAEEVIRSSAEALERIVEGLLRGPMTGTAVRAIVGG